MIRLPQPNDPPNLPYRIDAGANLWQCPDPGGGYNLLMNLELGNPNSFPFTFDTVAIGFTLPQPCDPERVMREPIEQRTCLLTGGRRRSEFRYVYSPPAPSSPAERAEEDVPLPVEVRSCHVRGFPRLALGVPRQADCGGTEVRLVLQRDDVEITLPLRTLLPSRSTIPVIPFSGHAPPGASRLPAGSPLIFVRLQAD